MRWYFEFFVGRDRLCKHLVGGVVLHVANLLIKDSKELLG